MFDSKFVDKISHLSISVSLQIILVSLFINIFFFAYVQKFEQQNFKSQMNYVVDTIASEIKTNVPPIDSSSFKEEYIILTNGVIDMMKINNIKKGKNVVSDINNKNSDIKKRSYKIAGIISLIFIAVICLIYYFNRHSIEENIQDSLVIIFFIGLCEYLFLNFVVGKYMTVNSDMIKHSFGESVVKWIDENKN